MPTKEEIHGYRDGRLEARQALWDEDISRRHREWGAKILATDIDRVLTEQAYEEADGLRLWEIDSHGKPYALIEYKHWRALSSGKLNTSGPTYSMYKWIAHKCEIPALVCVYWPETWAMHVIPLNYYASRQFGRERSMTEVEFVRVLHSMRGLELDPHTASKLGTVLPPLGQAPCTSEDGEIIDPRLENLLETEDGELMDKKWIRLIDKGWS